MSVPSQPCRSENRADSGPHDEDSCASRLEGKVRRRRAPAGADARDRLALRRQHDDAAERGLGDQQTALITERFQQEIAAVLAEDAPRTRLAELGAERIIMNTPPSREADIQPQWAGEAAACKSWPAKSDRATWRPANIRWVRAFAEAGLRKIELGSLINPKLLPQPAGAAWQAGLVQTAPN